MTNSILQSKGLQKTYAGLDVAVLNGIDLDVQAGEQVAIVGTSGSGKSTLCYFICLVAWMRQVQAKSVFWVNRLLI